MSLHVRYYGEPVKFSAADQRALKQRYRNAYRELKQQLPRLASYRASLSNCTRRNTCWTCFRQR